MKKLISLLLIISITTFSWYSCAKGNTKLYVNAVSIQPAVAINTKLLTPSLSNQLIDESFNYTSYNSNNSHNSFFEFAIVFNEKLQQFIAFFTRSSDKFIEVVNDNTLPSHTAISKAIPSKSSPLKSPKCKKSHYKT